MADMGTREAAEHWGVTQERVRTWCRTCNNPLITQDKKGSPWHIPVDFPNPFDKKALTKSCKK